MNMLNISKLTVTHLVPAPLPQPGKILQIRSGKVKRLGNEKSGIFKDELEGPISISQVGIVGDEHVYFNHGGIDRAIHQYAASHYADWRGEKPDRSHLFNLGAFGENLSATNLTEENVCIGDVFRVGESVLLEVSEPRNPCYKLNIRFQWPRALKRIQRTGRVGWNYRVLQTGRIRKGDPITLVRRPNPRWSLLNVQSVVHGKSVDPQLLEELSELKVLTNFFRDLAAKRLESCPRTYTLTEQKYVTKRVRQLTFELNEPRKVKEDRFPDYAYAQIEFGPRRSIVRSYSIVSGNLRRFTLGIALDDNSQGGSRYLHKELKIGDEIGMAPGIDREHLEHDRRCTATDCIDKRIVIIGGIGVTAFLPIIAEWESSGLPYEVHYAVRSLEEAAFNDVLPAHRTTIYAKTKNERLDVSIVIPEPSPDGTFRSKVFSCGPTRLMDACRQRTTELGYPDHMVHFEDFGSVAGGVLGDPFDVKVKDVDSGRGATLHVPSDKSLLQILQSAGFDVMASCRAGKCGSCKIDVCRGRVDRRGHALSETEKMSAMLSCVDRGITEIRVEID